MVNKREVQEFFKEMESSGVASFAPENVLAVITNPLAKDEEEELEETRMKEMPHYQIGAYKHPEVSHVLDLELETCKGPDDAEQRLLTLASGGSFESKNRGSFFSIPDRAERDEWIEGLRSDQVFRNMLMKLGVNPNAIISKMIDISKKHQ